MDSKQRKQVIREYVEARGGVEQLSGEEKKALAEVAKKTGDKS